MIVEKQSGKILAELGEADESARELSPKKTQQIEQKPAFFLNAVCSTEKEKFDLTPELCPLQVFDLNARKLFDV